MRAAEEIYIWVNISFPGTMINGQTPQEQGIAGMSDRSRHLSPILKQKS